MRRPSRPVSAGVFACATLAALVVLPLLSTQEARACLWDRQTLAQEHAAFPGVLELITGAFPRLPAAYYEWRLEDSYAKLETSEPDQETTLRLRDDIGVSYDKLGRHDEAIQFARETLELDEKRYESHANLGTFLIHAGQFESGLQYLRRAVKINPEAHFGREIYQIRLVEWVLKYGFDDEGTLRMPLRPEDSAEVRHRLEALDVDAPWDPDEFDADETAAQTEYLAFPQYLHRTEPGWHKPVEQGEELPAALHGVLGMMRFGSHDSPILLEALAELLIVGHGQSYGMGNPKQLASRAYLQASYVVEDEQDSERYRAFARAVLGHQAKPGMGTTNMTLDYLESEFQAELEDARKWYVQLVADVERWIAEGEDVDAQFEAAYLSEPVQVFTRQASTRSSPCGCTSPVRLRGSWAWLDLAWLGLLALVAVRLKLRRQTRHTWA